MSDRKRSSTTSTRNLSAGIARWVNDFQEGRIEKKTVDDLKKLIEIDIELQKDEK